MAASHDITVSFPGGLQVEAAFGNFRVLTDQPVSAGGTAAAPSPFEMFLASLATCAGFFMVRFCQARSLDASQLKLVQHVEQDPETHGIREIRIEVEVPPDFPDRYLDALVRAADQCTVKRTIAAQPPIVVRASKAAT